MIERMKPTYDAPEDIFHDVLLRIVRLGHADKCWNEDSGMVTPYFYLIIRSYIYDSWRKNNKYKMCSVDDSWELSAEPSDMEKEYAWDRLYRTVSASLNDLGSYNSKLSRVYFGGPYSLRKLAIASGISVTSIYNSVRAVRNEIARIHKEDYEDFKNKDYSFIKEPEAGNADKD